MAAPLPEVDLDPFPPAGFDRCDGLDGRPGTYTPVSAVTQIVSDRGEVTDFIEEFSDSPSIERSEQTTCVHRYRCDPETATAITQNTSRGDLQADQYNNVWKVLSCKMEFSKGGYCILTITSEYAYSLDLTGGGLDTPPDEFTIDVIEFNPALQKHPRYTPIQLKNKYLIQRLQNKGDILSITDFSNIIQSNADSADEDLAMQELICKLRKGIDSFYLAGFRINYSTFSYNPQLMNPGGYVEDPIEAGLIPYYFTSQDQTPEGQSIFDFTNAEGDPLYPMLYGNGLAWLRVSDTQVFQRTWFKLTKSWIAAPGGGEFTPGDEGTTFDWLSIWDAQIYEKQFSGYNTAEIQ